MIQKLLIISIILLCAHTTILVSAQENLLSDGYSVAQEVLMDADATVGDIISLTNDGYVLADKPYDSGIAGVVVGRPALMLRLDTDAKKFAITNSGKSIVRVTNSSGAIAMGDPITSSEIPGVAMKAVRNGFVIGNALEPYDSSEVGTIQVAINVRSLTLTDVREKSVEENIKDVFNAAAVATTEEPSSALKYIVAFLIVVLTSIAAFVIFARLTNTGVRAIARNPLAARHIQLGILFNTAIALSLVVGGVIIIFFILG